MNLAKKGGFIKIAQWRSQKCHIQGIAVFQTQDDTNRLLSG
jgi:hypothetical protein